MWHLSWQEEVRNRKLILGLQADEGFLPKGMRTVSARLPDPPGSCCSTTFTHELKSQGKPTAFYSILHTFVYHDKYFIQQRKKSPSTLGDWVVHILGHVLKGK